MAKKQVISKSGGGKLYAAVATDTSVGAVDAGEYVMLNGVGVLDESVLPNEISNFVLKDNCAEAGITAGKLVALTSTGFVLADNGDITKEAMGVALTAGTVGQQMMVAIAGRLTIAGSSFAKGTRYYLGTGGAAIATPPDNVAGKISQFIGKALSTTSIHIEFGETIITTAL
ncbi:hypothetical protein [Cellulophaga sp. BC115SP]|uniref:hypothetical protein n=1 Tax=Cellulophaga sp. BC115SP TaxID=2683263 RepID=UPI0014120B50|nr:hypothetical protein [Cellulophaga sp. BC115SP]NBB31914.1 hypothetical protein [Cellulophaga sp. BC115SP]